MKKKNDGFTLAELLVVVAIIGVLVAISIPIFSQQLHKARVAADWANVRSYYAQLQYDFMETETVKDEYMNAWPNPRLTSFQLAGQTVKLKAGGLWVAPEGPNGGYNLLYTCNDYHVECKLMLPED